MAETTSPAPQRQDGADSNLVERTVSELSAALKRVVEDSFGLVRVRGEIGRVSRPGSGHIYLDLKDDRAVLAAVVWKGTAARMKVQPEQGLEVVATGKLTTYAGQSRYQLVIEAMEPAGAGALMALLEERKRKLEAEGLFAEERKQLLPYMPRVIGVVTSPSGAVIRDVLHRIADRFPLHVIVWPVRVQGDTCGAEVAAAIAGFNTLPADGGPAPRPDLLIVARGGGSIEDLWGFNEEAVVRAAASSDIPLISAVGHETDWTLIDLAADRRAPTPTGAAEMAVPVKAELEARAATLDARLKGAASRKLARERSLLLAAARGLGSPDDILAGPRQQLDALSSRLAGALSLAAQRKQSAMASIAGRLNPGLLGRSIEMRRAGLGHAATGLQRAQRRMLADVRRRHQTVDGRFGPQILQRIVADARGRLEQNWRLMQTLSHASVLQRGFALVRTPQGKAVTSSAALAAGAPFVVEFGDGEMDAVAAGGHRKAGGKAPKPPAKPTETQGKLF